MSDSFFRSVKRLDEIDYGRTTNHSTLTGFERIEKIIQKTCGNIEVYGTCCVCHERKQKDYCKRCLN